MRLRRYSFECTLVDFRNRDLDLIVAAPGEAHMAEVVNFPRPIPVVACESVTRVVEAPIFVAGRLELCHCIGIRRGTGLVSEAAVLCLGHDPTYRDVGERVVGITTADVGMNARKPDLAYAFLLGLIASVRILSGPSLTPFIPQDRMKCRAFVIERQCMASALNLIAQPTLGKFQRPYPLADPPRHLVYR